MIAIEIQVNGQLVATCGADAVRQLVAMVAARGLADSMSFDTGVTARIGISQPSSDEILKWVSNRIAIGDEVTLRFLEGKSHEEVGELMERTSEAAKMLLGEMSDMKPPGGEERAIADREDDDVRNGCETRRPRERTGHNSAIRVTVVQR